jgi:hypothetical protein
MLEEDCSLIDIMYEQIISDITLGDFLLTISIDVINNKFLNFKKELQPFLNILNILGDFYKNYNKIEFESYKKY